MSYYRQDQDPSSGSSNSNPRPLRARYHTNPYASGNHTPSSHASSSQAPPSTNGPWDANAYNNWQNPDVLAPPPQHSADGQWDMSGRPLDRARSRQPHDYGTPLLIPNEDWNRASEMEQHVIPRPAAPAPNHWRVYAETQQLQPQPVPELSTPQSWWDVSAANSASPGAARQAHHYHAAAAAAPIPLPEASVSVVKEVVIETQPVPIQRRISFTAEGQRPVTTIQATAAQTSPVPDQSRTVTIEQLKAIKERDSDDSMVPEQGLSVNRNVATLAPKPNFDRGISLRKSFSRVGRKVTQAMKDALRSGADEPPPELRVDDIFAKWNTYYLQLHKKQTAMEDAYDPFQDQIEDAFNAKYVELKGEGKFLIDKESIELPEEAPIKLPVAQEKSAVPTEDADTWMAHKKEEAITEYRDPYTGSARRQCLESEVVVHPPKPRTYPADPPPPVPVPQPEEPELADIDQHCPTPSPMDSRQPVQLEAEIQDEQPKTPSPAAKEQESRLPRPTSTRSGRSVSRQRATGRHSIAAQPVEKPKPRTPSKVRKDSVQTRSSAKAPAQPPAQSRERYAKIHHVRK